MHNTQLDKVEEAEIVSLERYIQSFEYTISRFYESLLLSSPFADSIPVGDDFHAPSNDEAKYVGVKYKVMTFILTL